MFIAYKSNVHLIGNIPDKKLRMCLVETFNSIQNLIEQYHMYNTALSKYEEFVSLSNQPGDRGPYQIIAEQGFLEARCNVLIAVTQRLREANVVTTTNIYTLIGLLNENITES